MSWRQVILQNPCHLRARDHRLVITREEESYFVPFEDITCLVIECKEIVLTASVLACCAEFGVAVFICDDHHLFNILSVKRLSPKSTTTNKTRRNLHVQVGCVDFLLYTSVFLL